MTQPKPKNPARVKGGQERQRRLREQLGDDGYRERQQQLGTRGHEVQLEQWTPEQYRQQRKDAYAACAAKYGVEFARLRVRAASEARRRWRLTNPTPGEQVLRQVLRSLGLILLYPQERFDLLVWRVQHGPLPLTGRDALVEGSVGPYDCDILLPLRDTVIEFVGGVHVLQPDRDATRTAFLEAHGLQVIMVTDADLADQEALVGRLHTALQLWGGQ